MSGTLHTLWALTAGQRRRYGLATAAMVVGTSFLLSVPYILKGALDALADGQSDVWRSVLLAALAIVVARVFHGLFIYVRGRLVAQASEGIVRSLRHRLYGHLERLPATYHDHADTGDLVQRCSSDVETVRVFLASQLIEIGRVAILLLVAIPIMFWQDITMTLLSLSLVPVIVTFAILYFRQVRRLFLEVDEAEARLTTVLQENLTGIRVVRAFSRQEYEIEKFRQRNGEFRDIDFQLMLALTRYWTVSDLLVFSQLGVVLIAGGYFVVQGTISIGTWVLFWWMMRTIIWPVRHIGRVLSDSGKAVVALGRIGEILSEAEESQQPTPDRPVRGDIEVRNLSFRFGDGQPVLDDLSLSIKEGETVALLGPPGAGKTTLVNLLARLYEYQQGSIVIGGDELRTLNRDAVRDSFGMVMQDPFLYSKTVRENIVIGRGTAAENEVKQSTRAADIHANITDFEQGYDTMVGERGVTLSGGQRQRLAIARALLKNPQFLVLDDSLSAVDTKTEAHILRALADRKGRRTTILIAHRLSSTRLADRIFVLDHGRLVQQGTHDELLAIDGPYQRLWRIQGMLEEEIESDLKVS